MYTPSHFEISDDESLNLINNVSFGQIMVINEGQITQTYIPFELNREEMCLFGHVAKKNDLIGAIRRAKTVYVNFLGEHAYISPNWYASKEQVPTWNYQVVEVEGKVFTLNEDETLAVITRLSNIHEKQFDQPWTMDKLSEKKTNAMLRAITGFKIEITKISGKSKMSQNKNQEDQESLIRGLESTSDSANHRVAKLMLLD